MDKEKYISGNSFNRKAYDWLIKEMPEIEYFIKKCIDLDKKAIKEKVLEEIELIPSKGVKNPSWLCRCSKCKEELTPKRKDVPLWGVEYFSRCSKCGNKWFGYNTEISQIDSSYSGLVYRAFQGMGFYLSRLIIEEYRKKLEECEVKKNEM